MLLIDSKTFNPDILYTFDIWKNDFSEINEHSHDFFEISIILSGSVSYTIADESLDLKAKDILLLNPKVIHSEHQKKGTESHQLHIGLTNLALIDCDRDVIPVTHPLLQPEEELKKDFSDAIQRIFTEEAEDDFDSSAMIKAEVMHLILLILRHINKKNKTRPFFLSETQKKHQKIVTETIAYFEKYHTQDISLNDLSNQLYISPTYLSKIFKEITGQTPISYLIQIRIDKAIELLKTKRYSIKKVAELVGYEDAYYFSSLFKKYVGISPKKFKKDKIIK